jgi:hypothetical protein
MAVLGSTTLWTIGREGKGGNNMDRSFKYAWPVAIILVLLFPLMAVGQDLTLTDDGKVPGKPFQALQEQIDDLQQQIFDLRFSCPTPAYSASAEGMVMTSTPAVVMSKTLPPGEYASTISMGFQYPVSYGVVPDCWAFVECSLTDADGKILAGGVGGNVVGIATHSATSIIGLDGETDTTVVLTCFLGCEWCPDYIPNDDYPDPTLMMGGANWTFIRVGHN